MAGYECLMLSRTSLDARDFNSAHDSCQIYAAQELKKCNYYLLKMAVIFMLPSVEEMYLIQRFSIKRYFYEKLLGMICRWFG